MEAKAKSGTKPAPKAEKKESAPPPTIDPAPAEPAPAEAPEPEQPTEEGAGEQQELPEGAEPAGGCPNLESLKPLLIGGAIVALGAILVGAILLAKKN